MTKDEILAEMNQTLDEVQKDLKSPSSTTVHNYWAGYRVATLAAIDLISQLEG